jgi:transcriptional regulator with XRE-family HTH domain
MIRNLRFKKNMTQAELASQIGVTFQQVQKYESGANRVSASRLSQIATVLDVEVAELFGTNPMSKITTPSKMLGELIAKFEKLSPRKQTALMKIIREM